MYLVDQAQYPTVSNEELEGMDKENATLKAKIVEMTEKVAAAEKDLNGILSEPTDQEIDEELEKNHKLVITQNSI